MAINFHINNIGSMGIKKKFQNFYTGGAFYDKSPLSEKDRKASLATATRKCLTKKEYTSKFPTVPNSTLDPFLFVPSCPPIINQKSNSEEQLINSIIKKLKNSTPKQTDNLPEPIIAHILSFDSSIIAVDLLRSEISAPLLKIYKETIVKKLNVDKEIVDALKNSDIARIFHKLHKKSTKAALSMGFSLKQIATIPSDQLSEYQTQFDNYVIPADIQNRLNNLSERHRLLYLDHQNLTTGQLCKILNELTDDQQKALEELHLNGNQLASLPDSIGNLSALEELYLANNQLASLPDSFGKLSALQGLILADNQLASLPDSFGKLSALEELFLANNQLASLPDSFGNLSALTRLTLKNNRLASLPDSIGNLSALQGLGLGDNQLASLPDSFGNLSALKKLSLASNQLASLPDSFGNLSALKVLHLNDNQLASLPDSFGKLSALKALFLFNTQLASLPDSFGNLNALKALFLFNNELASLPDSIGNLSALKKFAFSR